MPKVKNQVVLGLSSLLQNRKIKFSFIYIQWQWLHQYSDNNPTKPIVWMIHCHEDITHNTPLMSNNPIKTWSLPPWSHDVDMYTSQSHYDGVLRITVFCDIVKLLLDHTCPGCKPNGKIVVAFGKLDRKTPKTLALCIIFIFGVHNDSLSGYAL